MVGGTTQVVFEWLQSQPLILLLFTLSLADILTGVAAAFVTKTVSSDMSYKGMTRKAIMWMIVGVAGAVNHISSEIPVMKLTAGFYCFMEGLSIVENAGRAGVPIPAVLKDSLSKLNPTDTTATTTTTTTATVTTTGASTQDSPVAVAIVSSSPHSNEPKEEVP